jgi:hypothetical protein
MGRPVAASATIAHACAEAGKSGERFTSAGPAAERRAGTFSGNQDTDGGRDAGAT